MDTENLHTTDKQAEVFVLTVFNSFNEPSTGTYGHACTARFSNINTVHCQNIPAEKKKKRIGDRWTSNQVFSATVRRHLGMLTTCANHNTGSGISTTC